jgi:hypothetical protein
MAKLPRAGLNLRRRALSSETTRCLFIAIA